MNYNSPGKFPSVATSEVRVPGGPVDTHLVIGPNASLSGPQALAVFAGVCAVGLAIAGGFAWVGLWPVLPFAGLELAAMGAALAVVLRRNRYREVLTFDGDRLRVEFGRVGEEARGILEWPRGMTRVLLEEGALPGRPTRLVLMCGAQRLAIGHCLTDAERARLARRLKELIHPAWLRARPPAEAPAGKSSGD